MNAVFLTLDLHFVLRKVGKVTKSNFQSYLTIQKTSFVDKCISVNTKACKEP